MATLAVATLAVATLAVARAAMAMAEKARSGGMAAVGFALVVMEAVTTRRWWCGGGLFEGTASRRERAAGRG